MSLRERLFGPKVRKFRPVGGFIDGETSHVEVTADGRYRIRGHSGEATPLEFDERGHFSVDAMVERVGRGTWEEM